jgi:hypothetical protein
LLLCSLVLLTVPTWAGAYTLARRGQDVYLVQGSARLLLTSPDLINPKDAVPLADGTTVYLQRSSNGLEVEHAVRIRRPDGTMQHLSLDAVRAAWLKEAANLRGRRVLREFDDTPVPAYAFYASFAGPIPQGNTVLALMNWHDLRMTERPVVAQFLVRVTTVPLAITPLTALPCVSNDRPTNTLLNTCHGPRVLRATKYDWEQLSVAPDGSVGNKPCAAISNSSRILYGIVQNQWAIFNSPDDGLQLYVIDTNSVLPLAIRLVPKDIHGVTPSPDSPHLLVLGDRVTYLVTLPGGPAQRLPAPFDSGSFFWHGALIQLVANGAHIYETTTGRSYLLRYPATGRHP